VSKVCALIHAEPETPGLIGERLAQRGIQLEIVRGYAGERVPKGMDGRDALLVMGGPMGVYEQDRYPFLKDEIALIRDAVQAGKPVLGVCLGSQLLAAALGANVAPARKEIGWFPVTLTDAATEDPLWRGTDRTFIPFHWHGDAFEIPPGAVSLASSKITPSQAFRHGRNHYGLLFHMELSESMVGAMVEQFGDDLPRAGADRSVILTQTTNSVREVRPIATVVFDRWADRIGGGVAAR
jgi:GMP synthase (glutamine-hydrolysing)